MTDRETIDYDPAEALLQEGRSELSKGNFEKARWYFDQVLARRSDDPRALLGLSYITRQIEPPPDGGDALLGAQTQIVELVREKRYEEALDVLRREALTQPDNTTISKSVAHLETHLLRRRLRTLGGPGDARADDPFDGTGDSPDPASAEERISEAPTGEGPALRDPDDVPRVVRTDLSAVSAPSLGADRRALGSMPEGTSTLEVAARLLAFMVLIVVLLSFAYVALSGPARQ